MTRPFRILFVCSGNACRSVMAEAFARKAFGDGGAFAVGSAGIQTAPGQPAHRYAVAAAAALGGDATGRVSRQLTRELMVDNDLVLTASARHRDHAVGMLPLASRRTFTLREFARIAGHLPPAVDDAWTGDILVHARSVVANVAALRGRVPYVPAAEQDIADPPRRPGPVRSCAQLIAEAVKACAAVLVPTGDCAAREPAIAGSARLGGWRQIGPL